VTGNDVINSALRLINVLASGEVPTAAESQDALATLNLMMEEWSADRLTVFTVQRVVQDALGNFFNLVPGQKAYTYGPGGFFNVPRPAYIDRIGIISKANPIQPLELPLEYLTTDQYAAIPVKDITSSLPLKVWDDLGFPLRTFTFWCVPDGGLPVSIAVYSWTALMSFPDLATDLEFPPGYFKAIRYNLAVDLAPEFGTQVPPEVAAVATSSKAKIEAINAPNLDLRCDPALVSPRQQVYNWITDGYGRSFRG